MLDFSNLSVTKKNYNRLILHSFQTNILVKIFTFNLHLIGSIIYDELQKLLFIIPWVVLYDISKKVLLPGLIK
jgi:hypothetical protein